MRQPQRTGTHRQHPAVLRACAVLAEVLALFPSPFVHLGGDECPKSQWRASATARTRRAGLPSAGEGALQSWFLGHFDRWLAARGRRLIGWDEILEGVHRFEPVPPELSPERAAHVLGPRSTPGPRSWTASSASPTRTSPGGWPSTTPASTPSASTTAHPAAPSPGRNGPESSDARSTGRPQTCEPRCKEGARKAGPWDGGAVRRSPRTCRTEHRMCRRARPAAPFRAPPPTRHTAVPVPSVADETGREPCPGTDRRFVDPRAEGPGRCARVATSGL